MRDPVLVGGVTSAVSFPEGALLRRLIQGLFRRVRQRPKTSAALLLLCCAATAGGGAHFWASYHFHAAEQALQEERYRDARDHVRSCLRVWWRSAATHLLAARVERLNGDYARAETHLAECRRLEHGPSDASQLEWYLLR